MSQVGQRMVSSPEAVVSSSSLMTAPFYATPHQKDHKILLRLWLTLPFAPLHSLRSYGETFFARSVAFRAGPDFRSHGSGLCSVSCSTPRKTLLICHYFIQRPPWVSVARGNVARHRCMGNAWNEGERGDAYNPQEKVAVHKGAICR